MKKTSVVMVALLVAAGLAYASSISVPWFVDVPGAPNLGYSPPDTFQTLIYLNNTTEDILECEIEYFNAGGDSLGPDWPFNTFAINPKASVAFRPSTVDPGPGVTVTTLTGETVVGQPRGQESAAGAMVPIRPQTDAAEGIFTGNGSATISWTGAAGDLQGMVLTATPGGVLSYAHLLPSGS